MATQRTCNTASVQDVLKCIRSNLSHYEPVSVIDPDKVTQQFKDFILDLLDLTARPVKPVLSQALKKAFEGVSTEQSQQWAGLIIAAVAHCRVKTRSFSSGAKTNPAVAEVIRKFLKMGQTSEKAPVLPVNAKVWRGARPSPKKTPQKKIKKREPPQALASATSIQESYAKLLGGSPVASPSTSVVAISDEETCAAEPASSSHAPDALQYFDQELLKMKKVSPDGQTVFAEMAVGPSGFLRYQWPGSSEWHQSEIPNLVLTSKKQPEKLVKKRPASAAAKKRPASAMAPAEVPVPESSPADAGASASTEPALHKVRFTQASKPPRTYVQACGCGGPGPHKLRLIVEYSEKRDGPLHSKKAEAAKDYIVQHKLSYSQAREIRSRFPQ
eukprot:Skav222169  [mRNA]  locus=scaffold3048:183076:184233:+ [translate_table: standard]